MANQMRAVLVDQQRRHHSRQRAAVTTTRSRLKPSDFKASATGEGEVSVEYLAMPGCRIDLIFGYCTAIPRASSKSPVRTNRFIKFRR